MAKKIGANLIKDDTIKLLSKFQILNTLTLKEIKNLLGQEGDRYHKRLAKLMKYRHREIVIKEGDIDSWVFWVVKGKYAVVKDRITIAAMQQPGEVFGEMSVLEDDSRTASVIAINDGVCLSIDMSVLDTLDDENIKDKISHGIQKLKSERINQTNTKLVAGVKKLTIQQKTINEEKKRLKGIEELLNLREIELNQREEKLEKWEGELKLKENKLN